MKKILTGIVVAGFAVAAIPLFSAFEAHVVNVTARIENALGVTTEAIDFGTVFPQEHLEQPLVVALSDSFLAESNADDVDYFIRQKPKCALTADYGETLVGPTWTGHVFPGSSDGELITNFDPDNTADSGDEYYVDCAQDAPDNLDTLITDAQVSLDNVAAGLLPSLCEYVSKSGEDSNDDSTPSFHHPFEVNGDAVTWLDTVGRLAKSENDTVDNWIIDLAVPCFGGFCAQDWADFVESENTGQGEFADDWTQDAANEHKIFGCNLWIEVSGVSRVGDEPEPEPSTITVTKVVVPIDELTVLSFAVEDFDLVVGAEPVDSGVGEEFAPDTYQVDETYAGGLTQGEDFDYLTSFTGDCDPTTGEIVLGGGENLTCTITNTEIDVNP